MKIIIPTYGRAEGLLGKEYFKDAVYVMPESQADAYRKVLPKKRMVTCPDDEDGDIVKKRNWILRNFPRPLIMVDDDVYHMEHMPPRIEADFFVKFRRMDYDVFKAWAHRMFQLADEMGARMWGVAQKPDEREYKEFTPFNMLGIVLGPFQGHLDHPLFFDERMGSKDDYDMSLQQIHRYGKLLRANFVAYRKYSQGSSKDANPGGLTGIRSQEYEITCCQAIMQKWGTKVIRYTIPPRKRTDLLNGRLRIPIRGV